MDLSTAGGSEIADAGRKGGKVVQRIAELFQRQRLNVELQIWRFEFG